MTTPAEQPTSPHESRVDVAVWTVVAALLGLAGTCLSAYSNIDPDVYWHRVLGQHWIESRSLELSVDPIAFTQGRHWIPTSWLVEVLYAVIVDFIGWSGIAALRLVLAVAIYLLLARFCFRSVPAPKACLAFATIALPLSLVIQDRPQTFSLLIVCAILPAVRRALVDDVLPRWWLALLVSWSWANVHGLWVLAPFLLAIATLCRAVERKPTWRASGVLSLSTFLVGGLTAVGPRLLLTPLSVGSSTSTINEWSATALRNQPAWGFASILLLLAVLALTGWSPGLRMTVYVVCVAAFGFWAHRNATFAALLLLPAAIEGLRSLRSWPVRRFQVPRMFFVGSVVVASLVGVMTFMLHAGVPDELPHKIAGHLRAEDRPLRVVTPYNVSGFLREFGGDQVRVSIDGRAERYGTTRIRAHDKLLSGRRGWARHLDRLRADAVVVPEDSALRQLLVQDGWAVTASDPGYVLIEPMAT